MRRVLILIISGKSDTVVVLMCTFSGNNYMALGYCKSTELGFNLVLLNYRVATFVYYVDGVGVVGTSDIGLRSGGRNDNTVAGTELADQNGIISLVIGKLCTVVLHGGVSRSYFDKRTLNNSESSIVKSEYVKLCYVISVGVANLNAALVHGIFGRPDLCLRTGKGYFIYAMSIQEILCCIFTRCSRSTVVYLSGTSRGNGNSSLSDL